MPAKPETTFIQGTHKYLPDKRTLHREKMNNPYSSGTADCWYSGKAADLWVEYKYLAELPKRDSTLLVPGLSEQQQDWCRNRFNEGRNVVVVLGTKLGAVIFRHPDEWANGLSTAVCRSRLVTRQALAAQIAQHCLEGLLLCYRPLAQSSEAFSSSLVEPKP